jgi:hypothetical protein
MGKFRKSIGEQSGLAVVGTTYGHAHCFSAFLKLSTWQQEQVRIQKELHFAVSLAGPFFTIYGRDAARFTEPKYKKCPQSTYEKIICLTVSPFQEYEDLFVRLRGWMEERFAGYRFVPFSISKQPVERLYVFDHQKDSTIYNALFNHLLFHREDDQVTWISGDEQYGFDAWEVENPSAEGDWVILPPSA